MIHFRITFILFFFILISLTFSTKSLADDGYRLWLKFDPIQDETIRKSYIQSAEFIAVSPNNPHLRVAAEELQKGLAGLLGVTVPIVNLSIAGKTGIALGLIIPSYKGPRPENEEGYMISMASGNVSIMANQNVGVLYGCFALLRNIQQHLPLKTALGVSSPKVKLRMLNHWDNPEGPIERGYAGSSLWKWYDLPETVDPRYRDYARANASIGINGTVVNNVNASARFLTAEYLHKVAALAAVFRQYGIKTYLSVYFAAPKTLGGLKTSDPLDPEVRQWWKDKVKEIYQIIPDFGGLLVKANSEGEPGPQDYGRTHADGANMLAEAIKPYNGVVIWRAFVYKADPKADRFKAAYDEFAPLDGKFDPQVMIQVKNGPIDFQPREPFSPLFGNMPKTPLGMEFQITQEYLGFATHMVYEAPIFKECLESDTYVQGKGSTVARIVDGSLHNYPITCMAGVANTGSDRNWTGHPMAQANWYAFGRLAWDHSLSSEAIADEWTKMTLTHDQPSVKKISNILLRSRDIYVNYNTPLGLSRPWTGSHFAPEPWQNRSSRPDWTAIYYHRADSIGLGFDRTPNGSGALGQYRPEVQKQWNDPKTCPLPYLLWFHHIPWKQKLSSGRTLWDELCFRFYTGADSVKWMQKEWADVKNSIDPEIHANVAGRLLKQQKEAIWWRDAWVLYLQTLSKQYISTPYIKPERTLEEVQQSVNVYLMR
ncbi:alpha-glucuronidase family glycosyl hydrolase [Dyadobacter sp. MSC1_007]|jgi:alpha-glucuronidase|uniref:alpha-glucuronidase family glycosyl hydrolase n=1 Tax=Dyadobacter sp. MSC1_007 TaxID=2909264 RepID=UPI00202FA0D0|nr:alpha-glucuronidase family glycosyl hydrolase [Dyadobacter sp. MSC1_007]